MLKRIVMTTIAAAVLALLMGACAAPLTHHARLLPVIRVIPSPVTPARG